MPELGSGIFMVSKEKIDPCQAREYGENKNIARNKEVLGFVGNSRNGGILGQKSTSAALDSEANLQS